MRFLQKAPDGGSNSGVTGYFLIEWKSVFSIVLLHFASGSREASHSHAFSAITLWLKGWVVEHLLDGSARRYNAGSFKRTPSWLFHRIEGGDAGAWALSIRGPWGKHWEEYRPQNKLGERFVVLTNGRKEVK